MSSLFKPAENKAAYLKAAFMGLAGSGKTYTATDLAIGMVKHMHKLGIAQAKRPVYFVDSESGSSWMVGRFKEAGIRLEVASTTAFTDLAQAMTIARDEASVLIIDSITAFWIEFTETYKEQKGRRRGLEFQDWGWLKNEWRRKFTNRFLNDPLHCIMCGRMGFEYNHYTDDTGKKQIEKTGVKLKAEGELGFEPSLLVQMERDQDVSEHEVHHVAHILKDRRPDSKSLDGKSFRDPTFASFLPHIEYLNLGGEQAAFDESNTSAAMIPEDAGRDNYGIRRDIVIDELDALLLEHGLAGTSTDTKTKRAEMVKKHFKCVSRTEIEKLMSLDDLRQNFDSMHMELTGKPSRYAREMPPAGPIDEIPFMEPANVEPPQASVVEAEAQPAPTEGAGQAQASAPLDKEGAEAALNGFTAAMTDAHTQHKVTRVWNKWATMIEQCDKVQQAEFLIVKAAAMARVKKAADHDNASAHAMQAAE